MSSEEFSLHQAFWAVEPGGPHGEISRWAALMAATLNGPLVKKNKQRFRAEEFWPESVWDEAPATVPMVTGKPRPMAPDLSHMRGMRVANRKR